MRLAPFTAISSASSRFACQVPDGVNEPVIRACVSAMLQPAAAPASSAPEAVPSTRGKVPTASLRYRTRK